MDYKSVVIDYLCCFDCEELVNLMMFQRNHVSKQIGKYTHYRTSRLTVGYS